MSLNLSLEQRLLALMILDLRKGLNIQNNGYLNYDFLGDFISDKDDWAIALKNNCTNAEIVYPEKVQEVLDVLKWARNIFNSFTRLSMAEQNNLTSIKFPKNGVIFEGFDGNDEEEYFHIAQVWIEKLNLFQESKLSDINSHMKKMNKYKAGINLYKSILNNKSINQQYPDDLTELELENFWKNY